MRKTRQNNAEATSRQHRYLNFKQKRQKKFKQQVIYLGKGKPTKGKADAKKVNKRRENREINATIIKAVKKL